MCGIYITVFRVQVISIKCKEFFHLLVSSLFVLSDGIVKI